MAETTSQSQNESVPVIENKPKSDLEITTIQSWQNKIFLWLIGMPTLLILLFIYMATKQVDTFNKALSIKTDSSVINKILPMLTKENNEKNLKWAIITQLEHESVYRRYNQGGLLLMSRIFVKYLGFFTGMILAILGAIFIIGKMSENSSNISGSIGEATKFQIVSSSPGIIFGTLGTILMLSTILQHNDIEIKDTPLYINPKTILSISAEGLIKRDSIDFDPSIFNESDSTNSK